MTHMLITPPSPFGEREKIERFIKKMEALEQNDQVKGSIDQANQFLKANDRRTKLIADARAGEI